MSPLQSAQLLDRIPWPKGGAYYVAAPMFHATGLATCALGLALGNRVVLARRFDAEATLAAIERHRVEALILVPTMLVRILDVGRGAGSLRHVIAESRVRGGFGAVAGPVPADR